MSSRKLTFCWALRHCASGTLEPSFKFQSRVVCYASCHQSTDPSPCGLWQCSRIYIQKTSTSNTTQSRCFNNNNNNSNNNNDDDLEVPHPQSGSLSTQFLIKLEFGNVGFWGEGITRVPGEKPLGAKERTNNKLNPHTCMASTLGFEPGPHWWETSALTTVPSLAPHLCCPSMIHS